VILPRRKGISYIMSVAIMTFVTLAMASIVLVWSLGITSTSQSTFSSAINANEAKTEERFAVEQIQFFASGGTVAGYTCEASNGCILLYVRNVGAIQSVYDAVFVNNQLAPQTQYAIGGTGYICLSGTWTGSICSGTATTPVKLSLGIQQLGSMAAPAPFPITSGITYTVAVSTTRGNLVTVLQTY